VLPELCVVINPEKPRKGSFDISLEKDGKLEVLWSGLKKGPPRSDKFPEPFDDWISTIVKPKL